MPLNLESLVCLVGSLQVLLETTFGQGLIIEGFNHLRHGDQHPSESNRFTSHTRKDENGRMMYQIKGSGVSYRWVYEDWSLASETTMFSYLSGGSKFWGTHMG